MDKFVKYLLFVFAGILIIAITMTPGAPKTEPNVTGDKWQTELLQALNAHLPCKIGTIGSVDSVQLSRHALVYNMTIKGDARIDSVYENHYYEFKTMILYAITAMNGQRDYGTKFAHLLEEHNWDLKFRIITPSKHSREWTVSSSELATFVDSYGNNPTAAMYTIICMQAKIMRLQLPLNSDLVGNIRTTSLNAMSAIFSGSVNTLTDIRCSDSDIEVDYRLSENEFLLTDIDTNVFDAQFVWEFTSAMAENDDFRHFLTSLAISHSNLVLNFKGEITQHCLTLRIPYYVIKENCNIAQNKFT